MCYNGFSRIRENAGFRTVLSAGREYRILTRPDCHFDNPAFCRMRAVSCKCRNICFILQARWPQERHGGTCREGLEGKTPCLCVFAFNGKRNFERKWRIFGRQRSRCPAGVRTA